MATPKKKAPAKKAVPKAVKAPKSAKAAAAPAAAAPAKAKRPWLVPVVMVAVLLGVGGQIYLRARYLASLKFDMMRIGRVVPRGSDRGQCLSVLSVAADKAGDVFVQEFEGEEARLQRFDAMLSPETEIYKPAKPDQRIVEPADMDVAADGTVMVLLKDGRVQVISRDLKYLRTIKTGLQGPSGVTVDSTGRLFVTSMADNKVVFFDAKGTRAGEFGAPGTQTGDLVNPRRIRATKDDELVIIESTEKSIRGKIFKKDLTLRKTFLVENLQFCEPVKLGVTGDGKAFLNDHMGARAVVSFDISNGKFFGESQITKDGLKFISPGSLGANRYNSTVYVHSVIGLVACYPPTAADEKAAEAAK